MIRETLLIAIVFLTVHLGRSSPSAAAEPVPTPQAGEGKGFEFRELAPPGGRLVGITASVVPRTTSGLLLGLQPIFAVGEREQAGGALGSVKLDSLQAVARPGYAVGGAVVHADDKVLGLRLIFFRIAGDRLDPRDRYESRWLGSRGGKEMTLGGDGRNIVGVAGRTTTVITSLGLLAGDLPSADSRGGELEFHSTPDYEQAVEEVRRWGVPLVFDDEAPGKTLTGIDLSDRCLTRRKVEVLARLTSLRKLQLNRTVSSLASAHFVPLSSLRGLRELEVSGGAWFGDAELALVRSWSRLERLDMKETAVSTAGLSQLAVLKGLKSLQLRGLQIQNASMGTIARLASLEELHLIHTGHGDEAFARLAELPALQTLVIMSNDITDRGVAPLGQISSLRRLDLLGSRFTAAGLQPLRELKLTSLHLGGAGADDAALGAMANQRGLETLRLTQTRLTDDGLKVLSGMKLKRIECHRNSFTGSGFSMVSPDRLEAFVSIAARVSPECTEWLGRCQQLQTLQLQAAQLTDSQLKHFAGLTAMRHLGLAGNPIGDDGIAHLATMKELRELQVSQTLATGAGFDAFPELNILTAQQARIVDSSLAAVGKLKKLRTIDLSGSLLVTDRGLRFLEELQGVKLLVLASTRVTSDSCATLAKLGTLERLEISSTGIDDEGLAQLAPLGKLREIWVRGTRVTDAGVMTLVSLSQLSKIYHRETRITKEGLQKARDKRYFLDADSADKGPDLYE